MQPRFLAIALRLSTKPVALVFRSGLIRLFKVQGTSPVAIPQVPKGWQILPFRLFLASALRGLYSIYAIYRGVGVGVGVVFGVVLGFGDGVCLQRLLRLENSIPVFQGVAQLLGHPQFGSVEQVSPKSLPSARRFT